MLDSMMKSPIPTRAEVSDVANAVLEGTDAVMLSGETTTGKFPIETVQYMASICEYAERNYDYSRKFADLRHENITSTIAHAVVEAAHVLDIKAIVTPTMSGYTAKRISNLKPKSIVLAGCTSEEVANKLTLNWGVYPFVIPVYDSVEDVLEKSKDAAKKMANLNPGDTIIMTGTFSNNLEAQTTNLMTVDRI